MEALQGKKIVLIVTGSIAAYKSADLVRCFVKAGAEVRVVLTQAATEFIAPLTLQTLSKHPVTTNLLNAAEESEIGHIRLADEADVVVVAPASADFIAKAAGGLAENAALAVLLATKAPIVIAPAMNVNMWENALTKRNVEMLATLGYRFVTPGVGELACGWFGSGRLADLDILAEEVAMAVSTADFKGKHVVVTAGPTREAFDPVRFVSNRSSGVMGYAIARAARRRGAKVTLISGPTALPEPVGMDFIKVGTAAEMKEELFGVLEKSAPGVIGEITERVLVMAAAVTDFRPQEQSSSKLKSDKMKATTIEMAPTPDILEEIGFRRRELEADSRLALSIVGFAAETGSDKEILVNAREKLNKKKVDYVIANRVEEAFEQDTNRVWIISAESEREIGPGLKDNVAEWILDAINDASEREER